MSGDVHVRFCEGVGVQLPRATHLVILVDGYPQWRAHVEMIHKRLSQELEKVAIEINEEKTRVVELASGGSFGFLGFDLREGRNRLGKRFVLRTPKKKKQCELLRRVQDILRRSRHKKLPEVLERIGPVITGWVNYFRVGNSCRAFAWVRNEIVRQIRRFMMKQKAAGVVAGRDGVTKRSIRSGGWSIRTASNTFTDRQ